MSAKQLKFKKVMLVIAFLGVLGTVIPNLLDTTSTPAEKTVICIAYLIGVPIVTAIVYFVGKKLLKG